MGDFRCHKCDAAWESQARQPGVKEICERCGAYLHCCKNCTHHRPSMHNQCYIPNTDWVSDRAGLNFCDEFTFRTHKDSKANANDDARAQAEALLGSDEGKAPSLDDLFGDVKSEDDPKDDFDKLFGG